MAEVLHHPRKPNGQSYYSNSGLKRSPASYSSFLSQAASPYTSSRTAPPTPPSAGQSYSSTHLPSATTPSSYQAFDVPAHASLPPTPASSVSFGEKEDRDEDIAFPSYDDGVQFYHTDEPLDLPPSPSDHSDDGSTARDTGSNASESVRSESPLPTPVIADDSAAKMNPSRHVDYLSHDWREEDIWSSWRHIVSQRKVYGQRSRLENASWRTWAKSKYHLPTVSPETLNWLKESDVTWLYGPLAPATSHPITQQTPDPSPNNLSTRSSFHKKPILKKRSMSEVMLQRSLSANSLIKQAAAAVQAQQKGHPSTPSLHRGPSDYSAYTPSSRPFSHDGIDYFSTMHSSGDTTPSEGPKRHIRFDDKVEQCIAIECKHDQDDYDSDSDSDGSNSSDSDEGVLTMRKPRRRRPTMARTSRPQINTKIIEKLPDTTLKYKAESPEVSRPSVNVPFLNSWYGGSSTTGKLDKSSSAETLRPSNPSRNFLLPSDDDDDVDPDMSWSPSGAFNARSSATPVSPGTSPMTDHTPSFDEGPSNMRRTPSGMFMPYDEDEDDTSSELGLFGRVSETINTARDIAHVIWNVGWRK